MKKIFYILSLLLILIACTEPIEIKTTDFEPVIVIYGVLTDEWEQQTVRITRSAPYFSNEPNPTVSGAEVIITSSEGEEFILLYGNSSGNYVSHRIWAAKSGVTYTLNVNVDCNNTGNIDNYQASTIFSPPVYLDSIQVVPIDIMGHANYALNIYGQDSDAEEYYLFRLKVNDFLVTNYLSEYILTDDAMFNGQYIDGLTIYYFNDIAEWKTDSEEQRKNSVYIQSGDKVEVEISVIPKAYYDFILQCQSEMRGENPMFGGPASNISTNISNGGIGFFTGYSSSKISTRVDY